MVESNTSSEPDCTGRHGPQDKAPRQSAGGLAEFILSGLALILPAIAFTIAAFVVYPPAATAMAPLALGLTFVGLGLVLIGFVAARRL